MRFEKCVRRTTSGAAAAWLLVVLAPAPRASAQGARPLPVTMRVDASRSLGPLKPIWRFFGADEPNYATMPDGRKLLGALGELRPEGVYFRAHNLLTTGDGTPALKWGSTNAYTEDAQGRPVYDWKIVDGIFDAYRAARVRPYVEIGFMPKALSVQPEPYQHQWKSTPPSGELFTGWAYPPKDMGKWSALVEAWVRHAVQRYGRAEVEGWYWQTWNEANIGYWKGTREQFFDLHDATVTAVRRALPTARVGGPHMAGSDPAYLRAFLEHQLRGRNRATGEIGTPLDFISFHAKGNPSVVDEHVRMSLATQLRGLDAGFSVIASYPELKDKPVIIGESDPEGCAACQGPRFAYRNGTMYSSYTAASFARHHDLAARHGVNLEGALTWAFEFEGQGFFPGFRVLASGGIDHPVLNVFRMFSRMGAERIAASSSAEIGLNTLLANGVEGQADVAALASRDPDRVTVLAWHYHDDDLPGPTAEVTLELTGLPPAAGRRRLTHYRVDEEHGNAYAVWKRLGSPAAPDRSQYAQLEAAGKLARLEPPSTLDGGGSTARLRFALPRQAVSLLVLEWD
jgi:xylan 1,4-beta-xylosidase